jgi:hypothetical protein
MQGVGRWAVPDSSGRRSSGDLDAGVPKGGSSVDGGCTEKVVFSYRNAGSELGDGNLCWEGPEGHVLPGPL